MKHLPVFDDGDTIGVAENADQARSIILSSIGRHIKALLHSSPGWMLLVFKKSEISTDPMDSGGADGWVYAIGKS